VGFLRDHAAGIGAAATAAGGVLYVFLNLISSWVYEPLGATPAQVGLGYGPTLIGAAALLLWLALAGAAFVALALAATWIAGRMGRGWWLLVALFGLLAVAALMVTDPFTAALTASVAIAVAAGRRWPGRRYAVSAAVGVIFGVVIGMGAVLWWADYARDQITGGYATSGPWSGPWAAQVVSVRPTDPSSAPELPTDRCLLYLGEANGMSMFFDSEAEGRSLRVPTAGPVIEIRPGAVSASDCGR
jgi:hypothetical protein